MSDLTGSDVSSGGPGRGAVVHHDDHGFCEPSLQGPCALQRVNYTVMKPLISASFGAFAPAQLQAVAEALS